MLTKDDKNEIKDIMVTVLKETVMPIIENINDTLAGHSEMLNSHSEKFITIDNKLDKHQEMIYTLIEDVDEIKTEMIMGNQLRKTTKGKLSIMKKNIDIIDKRVDTLETTCV